MSDELPTIEREIREWTARPPARSPRVARTRVLARIEERRAGSGWRVAAPAAALAVALAFGLLLRGGGTPSGPRVAAVADLPSPGLLVYELRSGTKLYLELAAASAGSPTPDDPSTVKGIRR